MHRIAFGRQLRHARRSLAIFLFVECLAETFAGLSNLFVYLFVLLGEPVFDEYVRAVTFLGVFVVDERVVECAHVARGLPCFRVHEYRGVYAHDIVVQLGHGVPPISFDVVFQLDAHLPVVVHGTQSVVYLAGRKYESVLFAVRYQFLEQFFLCHVRNVLHKSTKFNSFMPFAVRKKICGIPNQPPAGIVTIYL